MLFPYFKFEREDKLIGRMALQTKTYQRWRALNANSLTHSDELEKPKEPRDDDWAEAFIYNTSP